METDAANVKLVEFMHRRRNSSPQRRVSRDGQHVYCRFNCGKKCTRQGIHSHELYHCKNNPDRRPREFGREACPVCGKTLDEHYLRQHMFTQHTAAAVKTYNNPIAQSIPVAKTQLKPSRSPAPQVAKQRANSSPPMAARTKKVSREHQASTRRIEVPSMVGKNSGPSAQARKALSTTIQKAGRNLK